MIIVHVTPLYLPWERGAERHVRQVAEHLASRGHQVMVLTNNVATEPDLARCINGGLPEREQINGVSVSRVPVARGIAAGALKTWEQLRGGYRSLTYLFSADGLEMLSGTPQNLNLISSILRSHADVVVTWNWHWPPAYHAYLARRFKRFAMIGVPLFHTAEPWVHRPIYDRMIRACDGFIVNTVHEKEFIQSRVPTARRITAVGPGIDPQVFTLRNGAEFRRRYGLGQSPLVGFIGNIGIQKGADVLLQAMPLVWKWNKNVQLVVVGFPSHTFAKIEHLYRDLSPGGRERVLILPNLPEDQKVNLCDALDVFALPSTSDSFGIAYLEAWMCRKPVIGCSIGSTACVIQDGLDGLLVNPGDAEDLAKAIRALLSDPDRRTRMGERGFAKTLANFTWTKVADQFERFCLDLIADRSSKSTGILRSQTIQ
jgi:glycosyltransferase involved in cell wall biosynthesis